MDISIIFRCKDPSISSKKITNTKSNTRGLLDELNLKILSQNPLNSSENGPLSIFLGNSL